MNSKFHDEGKSIYDFLHEFYIKCPQCGKFTVVKSFPNERGSFLFYKKRSLVCNNCGFVKVYRNSGGVIGSDYPLWLEVNCCGEKLWSYNLKHLEYIERFVSASIREGYCDEHGWKNNSMVSRLPKWIKERKNRDEILKCIKRMKDSIPKNEID
ncbi:MAG: hypothetical protein N4A57_00185 [Anaeromicrobium sp.]|jgi:predicted RNA-binding Zn-ribbon protein involved in translation (DUF1610 family)|uniref:hypothetical protein n=1 Tax=Anaeromicrobium sp. TaxID=1929132 RepID=UPI0025D989A0|nr:hypothetical protein [Anaeromicrobium sp.]MCT4592681.1 hypothetical protein [Anaeromicrobium sp.]